VSHFQIQRAASHRLDDIYVFTREHWGEAQAERYIRGMFDRFEAIAARDFPWRTIPAEFAVQGYVCKYERHYIYWKQLAVGNVGIVTILHERMHQIERLQNELDQQP
jgi:toxin ParE1/3/4